MLRSPFACALGLALAAPAASAQLTLAMDIQGIDYQFRDAGGAPAFGGALHTGTVEWSGAGAVFADTRTGTQGRFGPLSAVTQTVALLDVTGTLSFVSGVLDGGTFEITLDNSEIDAYSATIEPGTGQIMGTNQTGFTLDGLTLDGGFSDSAWGDVDVTPFFEGQTEGGLPGAFFQFRFRPTSSGDGNADVEVFVMVPTPQAAAAGIATLAGLGGLAWRRRRGRLA